MSIPNRRAHARFSCDIEAAIFPYTRTEKIGDGRVVDIALGGARILCGTALLPKVPYRLRLAWRDRPVEIDTRVAREIAYAPGTGDRVYGVVFNASSSQEHRLRSIIEALQPAS